MTEMQKEKRDLLWGVEDKLSNDELQGVRTCTTIELKVVDLSSLRGQKDERRRWRFETIQKTTFTPLKAMRL